MSIANDLLKLLPPDVVRDDSETLKAHASDKWYASESPDVVVLASSVEHVEETMRFAASDGIPVTTRGGGVGYVGGCVPVRGGIALSVRPMNRIIEIHPEDGVAVVEAGVVTGDLQDAVKHQGFFYPPDPASLAECTIGGNIATNAGGPRCLKYGVTRHYVLGLEVVLANGTRVRTGSRCHKNKTGFDLMGMFIGSEGMLGVVTEATLRLLPHPPMRSMVSSGFTRFSDAAEAVQKLFRSGFLPSAVEIADAFTLDAARDYLGTEILPGCRAHLLVEIDGQAATVPIERELIARSIRESGAPQVEIAATEEECERIWGLRRDFSYSLRATGLVKLNEDIVVPRSRLVDLVDFTSALQEETGYAVASFGHAGDGNIHVNIMIDNAVLTNEREKVDAALDRLFKQILDWGGVVSGEHGIGLAKKRWFPEAITPEALAVHQSLKNALDPQGILNPGKFLDE